MSAAFAVVWGLFVANPFVDTFARNLKLYAPMISIVPFELFWGLLFISIGAAGVYFSLTGRKQWTRLMMVAFFGLYAALFFLGDATSAAWGLYGVVGIFNAIHYQAEKRFVQRKWKLNQPSRL